MGTSAQNTARAEPATGVIHNKTQNSLRIWAGVTSQACISIGPVLTLGLAEPTAPAVETLQPGSSSPWVEHWTSGASSNDHKQNHT